MAEQTVVAEMMSMPKEDLIEAIELAQIAINELDREYKGFVRQMMHTHAYALEAMAFAEQLIERMNHDAGIANHLLQSEKSMLAYLASEKLPLVELKFFVEGSENYDA